MKKLTLNNLGAGHCINLLKPIKCTCGCGGYTYPVLEGHKDFIDIMGALLSDVECNAVSIIIMTRDKVYFSFKNERGINLFATDEGMPLWEQIETVKEIIDEFDPHCVGIFQHRGDDCYRPVVDYIYD